MGFLNGLMGNVTEYADDHLQRELQPLLVPGETVEKAFKLIRDRFVFTNKRPILLDKQGVTGTRNECVTIPYKNITRFARGSAGLLDLDA